MAYITMPRITTAQRAGYLSALYAAQASGDDPYSLRDLLQWLYTGAVGARARAGKESAYSLIQNFVAEPDKANIAFSFVHDNNDTLVACDGYRAAVILNRDAKEWDMSDAYITGSDGIRKTLVQDTLTGCRRLPRREAGADIIRALLTACAESQDENRRRIAELKIRRPKGSTPMIHIDADGLAPVSKEQALSMLMNSHSTPMRFNTDYLQLALRFILSAGTDEIEYRFSHTLSPLFLHAGNLYAVVLPLRLKSEITVHCKNTVYP